jgi:hypothetical protein
MTATTPAKPKRVGARIMPQRKPKEARKSKFNAVGERYDGHYFQSKAELLRYQQLTDMKAKGLIDDLELQPNYAIVINNQKICSYRADFRYKVIDELGKTMRICVEDVKGWKTDVYTIKKKLVEAVYGITLCEVPASKLAAWADRLAP